MNKAKDMAKNMKKKVILLKESSLVEIQSVLEDEARNGWFFVKKSGYRYYFEKKKRKDLKYRLLPMEDRLSDKEIQKYKEDGWEYVNKMSRTAVFCGKQSASEIKLQPKKTEKIISKIKTEINFQIAFIFIISVIAVISWVALTFSKGYFLKNIADNWNSNFSIPLVYISLIIFAITLLIDKIDFYKAFKKLPATEGANVSKKKRLFVTRIVTTSILLLGAVVVFGLTMANVLKGINGRDARKYKGENIVALMDIEEVDQFYTKDQYENLGIVQNVNSTPVYEGIYSLSSSLICKEHLTWNETLECETEKYYADLKGEYYNLTKVKTAKKIYDEIVSNIEKENKRTKKHVQVIPKRKYSNYTFDEMYVIKVVDRYVVVVREKNEIYSMDFSGKKTYKEVLNYISYVYTRRAMEKNME